MAYLSDYTEGRDNNFNLLRLLFALCVVVAHGFNIYSNSPYDSDPVIQFSYGFGFAALDAFFVLSGFMITSSLIRRKDPVLFFVARWLRIFPALIVVTIVVSLLLGPLVTKVSLSEYFLQLETYTYLIVTGLTTDPDMTLPGVFLIMPPWEQLTDQYGLYGTNYCFTLLQHSLFSQVSIISKQPHLFWALWLLFIY